jgi:hypothetical protein
MIDITAVAGEGVSYDLSTFLLTTDGDDGALWAYFDTDADTNMPYVGSTNLIAAWSAESTGDD